MRVLVTGASTPMGTALIRRMLSDAGVERVLAIVPPVEAGPGHTSAEALRALDPGQRLNVLRVDLMRPRDVRRLLFSTSADERVDVLVHGATHRAARRGGEWAHALNVDATRALLQLSERHPTLRRFVYRSYADVYRLRARQASIIVEDHPLELFSRSPPWVQDRMEADLTVCTRMGQSALEIVVLRCAECLGPACGSQLYDYLTPRICYTPMGFDPMLNVLSIEDTAEACFLAARGKQQGVFNVPGADTLPLSEVIFSVGRRAVPVPSALLGPLYGLRAALQRTAFLYRHNYYRFHYGGILDGRRCREAFGYEPRHPIVWSDLAVHLDRERHGQR